MPELNASIRDIPIPPRMQRLPISDQGFPIPWFVPVDQNGKPVTQAADPVKRMRAHRVNLCWVCGQPLGKFKAFVLGPMCAVNRITSEPPCHRDCAEYSVRACPFLSKPNMRRNPTDIPGKAAPPGLMIERNPRVALIWIALSYRLVPDGRGSWLFNVGDPVDLFFYSQGRRAMRAEIMESIESGMPLLRAKAFGREANEALDAQYQRALTLVPAD